MIRIRLIVIAALFLFQTKSQASGTVDYVARFKEYYFVNSGYNNESYRDYIFKLSKTGSAYDFEQISFGIDALTNIYKATCDTFYLNDGIEIIKNVFGKARISNQIEGNTFHQKTSELGWIDNNSGTYMQGKESQLYEGKLFKSITAFIFQMHCASFLNNQYKTFVHETIDFINQNVWIKWYNRSYIGKDWCGHYLLNGRTHMAAHWATIAMYLELLLPGSKQLAQYKWLTTTYNKLLRTNFRQHPLNKKTYIWNSTWDEGWKVGPGCTPIQETAEVQDMSHGNEVISYIIKSYELGLYWNRKDIKKMNILVTELLWMPTEKAFFENITSDNKKDKAYYFVAEGYAKLGRYSKKVSRILNEFIENESKANFSRQGSQLMAVLAANTKH